jgi:hypothetical protein
MNECVLKPGQILRGPLFSEAMRVETIRAQGADNWIVGLVGTGSERFRSVTLTASDLQALTIIDPTATFTGDGRLLRLGLQAHTLGIAHEFDPYFGLSISRVDPLPHQLEAVYDYLLKLAPVSASSWPTMLVPGKPSWRVCLFGSSSCVDWPSAF